MGSVQSIADIAARHQRHDTHHEYNQVQEYRDIIAYLQENDDFVIGSHEQPDGDAIGSSFAFFRILTSIGKKARVLYPLETIPAAYRFLAEGYTFESRNGRTKSAPNAIVLECPNLFRLGREPAGVVSKSSFIINLDHHQKNDNFGNINLILPDAPSTTEIVYRIALDLGAPIDIGVATCLYVGLVSDTGRFQYSSTTGDTLRVAAELLDYGVRPNDVFQQIYEQTSMPVLKLLARLIGRMKLEDGVCWSLIRRSDLKATGANLLETEAFVDYLRSVVGTDVAVLFKETGTGYRVSLRSRTDLDVSIFADRFGGGGHKKASGCKTTLTPRRFLTALKKYMRDGTLPKHQPFHTEPAAETKSAASETVPSAPGVGPSLPDRDES